MQRRREEARRPRWWTRLFGGSALTVAVALPAAALAEPASGSDAAEVGATAQPEATETQSSYATTSASALEEPAGGRSNCPDDYAQSCFQPGSSRPRSAEPESYAQSHFQPGAEPAR
jgi:hypothetical protein